MFYKRLLKTALLATLLCSYNISFGAGIDHFDIESSKDSVKTGEAFDITITAVDANGATLTDYDGNVLIFSETDPNAELPSILEDNSYQFSTEDQGVVKFENGIKFTKEGEQIINVFDINYDDVYGDITINVSNSSTTEDTAKEVSVEFPVNDTIIGKNNITVNGKTDSNHQVIISLDGSDKYDVISDSDGVFEKEISELTDGKHSLIVTVLNSDEEVIGTSDEVIFTVSAQAAELKSVSVDPKEDIQVEDIVTLTVVSEENLALVRANFNDTVKDLTETDEAGVYTTQLIMPDEEGNYKVDITLRNELGVEFTQNGALEIAVNEIKELPVAIEPVVEEEEINCDDFLEELTVRNTNVVNLKTKSVLSWDNVETATSYNIYKKDRITGEMKLIDNITTNSYEVAITGDTVEYDDFAVKALLENDKCEIESTDYAEMTQVQTGPKEMAILILALILTSGLALSLRRKNS